MRTIVFRFGDIGALTDALEDAPGSLPLPDSEGVADGEWVLAIFEIGSRRRATAAAARGVRAAGDTHLAFERRDWDRLVAFVTARSEHMRASKPVASSSKIPTAPESNVPLSEAPMSAAPIESSRVPLGAKVLVVEEDLSLREQVRTMLAEIGLAVEAVETAEQATARMREIAFDALILDYRVKAKSLDFVRGIRKDPARAPLPVLFLSDHPSSRDVVEAFASGADDFLPRPFRAPELGARVFGLLRRARTGQTGGVRT